MVLLGDKAQLEARLVRLEEVRILTQDRCMVCAERTTGSEIVLYARDRTTRRRGSCGILFAPFVNGVSISRR